MTREGELIVRRLSRDIVVFSRNERTHPNLVSQAREIEIFHEDCKLAAPVGFFRGFGPRFGVHGFKSAWPAKNA